DGAGPIALVEHLLPGLASVHRAVDAAFLVRPPGVAERGHVDDVRIPGVDHDVADVARIGEADVLPGVPAIGGTIDAIAVGDVASDRRFARPDVDDVWIGLGDRDGADGRGAEEAVADVLPVGASASRLPDTPGARAKVEGSYLGWVAGNRDDPAPTVWTDQTPLERAQRQRVHQRFPPSERDECMRERATSANPRR